MNARWILAGTVTAAVLAAVAGCGSAAVGSSEARSAAISAPVAAPAQAAGGSYSAAGSSSGQSSAGSAGSGSSPTSPELSADSSDGDIVVGSPGADVARSVTASYTVPPGSFLPSFDTVIADAVALGGYVVGSDTSPNAKGRIVSGEVTLAVPTAQMASLLNSLPSDFTASSINFSSVDDTASIVDVNARLTSAQAHLTALQGLLAKATSLSDITTLEQQIEDVETSIDTDQGQLTTLNQAVTYATATIRLKERGAITVAVKVATGPAVSSGVSKGWNNALVIVTVALEVLVTAIPAVVLLAIGWAVWRLRRRRVAPTPHAEVTA
ncbi:MAG: DUF4349 domain-containing protein [Candidatus Dormibacteria bacterium]|jgi:hypothetical protein